MLYNIERRFYHSAKDIEINNPYRIHQHTFDDMTLDECQVVLRKLMRSSMWVDVITPHCLKIQFLTQ